MKKIKRYIKNYKYNNLPEILFLIGMFILSLGLSLRVESGSILGIYFYKSDLRSITTISKILGMVVISLGIIMNLKKYTNKEKKPQSLINEEKKEKLDKEVKINIAKTEAYLKKTGGFIVAVGWLTLIINLIVYIWYRFNGEVMLNSEYLIILTTSILYIILGKRIKNLNDIKIKLYLNLVAIFSIIFGFVVVYSGGRIGLLFFFLIGYLLVSLNKLNKAMKVKEFYSKLSVQKYEFNKNAWIAFSLIFSILFLFLIIRDIKTINSENSEINWEEEYNQDKPDLSYESFKKDELNKEEKPKSAWDEYDKLNNSKDIISKQKANSQSTKEPNWVTSMSKEDNFSVLVPSNLIKNGDTYTSTNTEQTLSYAVRIYNNYLYSDVDKFLEESLTAFLSPEENHTKLISKDFGYYEGYRILNFTNSNSSNLLMNGRFIYFSNKAYLILMLYDKNLIIYNNETYNKFINSFKILD